MVKKSDTTVREIRTPEPFLSESASTRRSRNSRNINNIDDIIVSLAEAHENRRARQVVEWVRQQSVRKAA